MYCSNCGAPLPPNGICAQCGVPATNMTFTGQMQGRPAVPQQEFHNPNPMYVQYQGPQQGYGQPFVLQENVAIRGIKDPRVVAGIGATIKNTCGSMMMMFVALFTTLAMIFSYIEMFYTVDGYVSTAQAVFGGIMVFFARCIPFTMFAIGAWMVTFQGYGTYHRKLYNDRACMPTSGFSTIQAGGIFTIVLMIMALLISAFTIFMMMIVGATEGYMMSNNTVTDDIFSSYVAWLIVTTMMIVMLILSASLISNMAKIKHAIRGRNYEAISLLLPVLLFVMAAFQIVLVMAHALNESIFGTVLTGVYAVWYGYTGFALLYLRSKINSYVLGY